MDKTSGIKFEDKNVKSVSIQWNARNEVGFYHALILILKKDGNTYLYKLNNHQENNLHHSLEDIFIIDSGVSHSC